MTPGKYTVSRECSEIRIWRESTDVYAYSEDEALEIAKNDRRDADGDRPDWSEPYSEDWEFQGSSDYLVDDTIYEPEEEEEEESAELVKPAGIPTVFLEGVEL